MTEKAACPLTSDHCHFCPTLREGDEVIRAPFQESIVLTAENIKALVDCPARGEPKTTDELFDEKWF